NSATTRARLARIVIVAFVKLRRSWVSARAVFAASGKAGKTGKERPRVVVAAMTHSPSTAGQDLGQVHRPHARLQPMEAATDLHQAGGVSGAEHLGSRLQYVARLIGEHRRRDVSILDGKRPPKPATFGHTWKFHQIDALDGAQELHRDLTNMQH